MIALVFLFGFMALPGLALLGWLIGQVEKHSK